LTITCPSGTTALCLNVLESGIYRWPIPKDLEARKKIIFDMQRYAAEQQYYVYLFSQMITGSWQPYVKNYAPNQSFDYGSPAAALWLER